MFQRLKPGSTEFVWTDFIGLERRVVLATTNQKLINIDPPVIILDFQISVYSSFHFLPSEHVNYDTRTD